MKRVLVKVSPSLALIKYWGKHDKKENIPATSSLAVTLKNLTTETEISLRDEKDRVIIGGKENWSRRYETFFSRIREISGRKIYFNVESRNTFPTSAGLASSSSGFAALAIGASRAAELNLDNQELSSLARFGSASAARAIFGGFTLLPRHSRYAQPFLGPDHWPELAVLILIVDPGEKENHSREAMEHCRLTSPFYKAWLKDSETLFYEARQALLNKDLEKLGTFMNASYLRMFSTMLGAYPPVIYWKAESIALIRFCRELRKRGFGVWETMDAGPQLKLFCLKNEKDKILHSLKEEGLNFVIIESEAGPGPEVTEREV